jgi:hypothetical protein
MAIYVLFINRHKHGCCQFFGVGEDHLHKNSSIPDV